MGRQAMVRAKPRIAKAFVHICCEGMQTRGWLLGSLVIVAATVLFWWPALFQSKLIVHGETIHQDLPFIAVLSNVLSGKAGILWNDMVYGGFPLFAEGQAAFANPIKLALALTFDPASAMMACHILATFLGALGILLLARAIGLSPMAGLFAGLAGGFSIIWIFYHNCFVVSGTIAVVPWALLAAEYWLRHANLKSVLMLAASGAMLVLSGYPMITHGTVLYILCRVAADLFYSEGRSLLRARAMRLLVTGVAASVLALGLSAVQLLPLLELVPESHRGSGIGLVYHSFLPFYGKGLLYSYISSTKFDHTLNMPSVGSALVSLLFLAGLFLCANRQVVAHAVAALFLFNLGMQDASPLFRSVYEHRLIPGLHVFRLMTPYLTIAVVGIALVAGGALDALAGAGDLKRWVSGRLWYPGGVLLVAALIVFAVALNVYVPEYRLKQLFAAAVITPVYLLLLVRRQRRWLLPFALCLLIAESVACRFGIIHFVDRAVLAEPPQALAVKADRDAVVSWRTKDLTSASGFGFVPPDARSLEAGLGGLLQSLTPMASLLWQVPTLDASSSLGLHRRYLIEDQIGEEFLEQMGTPGARIIDVLGVRYITHSSGQQLQYAREMFHEPGGWSVYKNSYALPHFQLYPRARAFPSPEEALKDWPDRRRDELFIESATATPAPEASDEDVGNSSIVIDKATPSATSLTVTARAPMWLFMADADYPGWKVYVNGRNTPHYSAQILGKAVRIPAGESNVEFVFESTSFRIGAMLSLISLLLAIMLIALALKKGGSFEMASAA